MSDRATQSLPEALAGARGNRLAASQLKRLRRIVDAAVELAQEGGFEAVRLRDVAESSGVALGTLYRYFRSKEDILVFALMEEMEELEKRVEAKPPTGATPRERVISLYNTATRVFANKPQFSRAVLRAVTSAEPETTTQAAAFHLGIMKLTRNALRGDAPESKADSERHKSISLTLSAVWFAALVGWTGGLHTPRTVLEQIDTATALMLPNGR